ncbi:hypothetical protein GCM10027430_29430 [Lysobacter tyrosinilyticus]
MKHPYLFIFLSLLPTTSRADDFTPAERKAIAETRISLEQSCQSQLSRMPSADSDAPTLARWLKSISTASDYCTCTAETFSRKVTPQMLRSGSSTQGAALVKQSGIECIVPKLKITFPAFCGDMVKDVTGNSVLSPTQAQTADKFCGCVQSGIDSINADNFTEFFRSTMSDYQSYVNTRELPPSSSPSLLATMQTCGIRDLKSKLAGD